MDSAKYKHVELGLIFLEYISDFFNEPHEKLKAGKGHLFQHFHEIIKSLMDKLENNTKESQYLADLRKTLLPKLMSGELIATEAEALNF